MLYAWDKVKKIVMVVKTEFWYMGIVALAAYKGGAAKVWMFPEGTRNTGNTVKLLPFKKGAFTLAVDAQVPIIPIVFSPHYFINDKKHIFYNNGKVIMRCLEPVPTEGLTPEDIPELQERLHQIMWDAFFYGSRNVILNKVRFHLRISKIGEGSELGSQFAPRGTR
ncbi:Acyltransferase AGPAT4 [Operophtera brumata]|uniref:1-acylglycerol-3-phosphate O-acyltransferase n=1 Tax=Operophtera brumata TaxID=104452 RepID=A0A0L7KZD6_OPEBR|nr:Acyltransferase AGPAT4 [Operophtera brumata]